MQNTKASYSLRLFSLGGWCRCDFVDDQYAPKYLSSTFRVGCTQSRGWTMDALVTRKGQVTIPVELRRQYKIIEGMKLTVEDSPLGIVFKVVPKIEDLAGVDAEKITIDKAMEIIDKMRAQDRY